MNLRNLVIWGVIVVVLIGLYSMMTGARGGAAANQEIPYSQMIAKVNAGEVKAAIIEGPRVTVTDQSNRDFHTTTPNNQEDLVKRLEAQGASISVKPAGGGLLTGLLLNALPILLLIGVWIFFMRQMQGGARGAMGFGKSKARLLTENKNRVTFDDVAGVDEAKEELTEIVDFLKDPQKFQRLGGKIPKGALLIGPPGTGKTLIARAVAGEAGVPFFTISGSDFVEMFVGVGASRVRDMFEQAKKNAPCIIFIDEIDAVGRHRGAGLGGGNDEREQTLNQLLVEMDGFEANEGIILIAATNRPDVLDPALLRPGRFDRQVVVPNPDINGRERILRVHMKNVPLAADVDVKVIARAHPGLLGRRPGQPGQRSRPDGRPQEPPHGHHARLRGRQGQGHDGRRAPVDGHDRGREEADGLPRGRPRPGDAERPQHRPGAQGHDHPARPRAGHGHAAAGTRQVLDELPADDVAAGDPVRRPRGRGADLRQGAHHLGRLVRHQPGHQAGPRHGDEVGLLGSPGRRRVRREPGRGVPGPLGRAATRMSRKRPRRSSTRRSAPWWKAARRKPAASSPRRSTTCTPWPRRCSSTRP